MFEIYVLAIGTVVPFQSLDSPSVITTLLLVPKWWLLIVAARALTGDGGRLLRSGIVARVLVPTLSFAMLLMASLIPAFQAAEQHWFEQDHLMMLDPEYPGFGIYEYKVTVQLMKELREIVGH
ncbi:MAG: hypothetical protein EOO38_30530 [Cytophagaceae bacterium]|nr:MAG: hypothetical protein EOO38_30530 [Cytophagaceae bacterium]